MFSMGNSSIIRIVCRHVSLGVYTHENDPVQYMTLHNTACVFLRTPTSLRRSLSSPPMLHHLQFSKTFPHLINALQPNNKASSPSCVCIISPSPTLPSASHLPHPPHHSHRPFPTHREVQKRMQKVYIDTSGVRTHAHFCSRDPSGA
jgi:hypothetical protein